MLVTAGVEELGAALGADLWLHTHPATTRTVVRTRGASPPVPAALAGHVSAVFGVAELLPVPPRRGVRAGKDPGDAVDPDVLAKQYGSGTASGAKGAPTQGFAAFEQAEFRQSDVYIFQQNYYLPGVTLGVVGPNDGGYFGEAGLDSQYITATGRGVPTWFIARDEFDMLAFGLEVQNMTEPPSVVSISWGSGESSYPEDHIKAGAAEFQKMGLAGISVFAASGDEGTGSQGFLGCKKFDAQWPAGCPYLTSAGGTYLSGGEIAWSGNGGGFSAVFPRPKYQDAAVQGYVGNATLPPAELYDAGGRGVPDVSGLSTNYKVTSGHTEGSLSGTSAAAPVFAGLVAIVNDRRAAKGLPPVGFTNPTLYGNGASPGFDVTSGNNKHGRCPAGFPAVAGWDAVTGLGTPQLDKLEKLLA